MSKLAKHQLRPGRKTKQPEWVQPMLATLTRDYFSDPDWIFEPKLAQVGFSEWTPDGRLRHPRFVGLRRDKKPREVVRESM